MEKLKYITLDVSATCSCGNHLLNWGVGTCEICQMPFEQLTDDAPEPSAGFDLDYFEALESYLESMETAA